VVIFTDGLENASSDWTRDRIFARINQLQKDLAFNHSGHLLHSLFWRNLEPNEGAPPSGQLEFRIKDAFGSTDAFRRQFGAAGAALQGSGWVALTYDPMQETLFIEQFHDHDDRHAAGTIPLLVMDMWEHAYYLQYRNKKAAWLGAFWQLVNWTDVAERLAKVRKTDIGL